MLNILNPSWHISGSKEQIKSTLGDENFPCRIGWYETENDTFLFLPLSSTLCGFILYCWNDRLAQEKLKKLLNLPNQTW